MKTNHRSTTPSGIVHDRDHRLARYCAAGAAGAAAFAGTVNTADAAVVYVNYNNQTVIDQTLGDSSFTLFSYDLDGNGTIDFRLGQRSGDTNGGGALIALPTGGALGVVGVSSSGYNYAAKLGKNVSVGAAAAFLTLTGTGFTARASLASGAGFTNSQWATPSPATGYLGIRFTGVGGVTEYGYVNLTVAGNTNPGARQITLIGAGYENTGAAILTGAGQPAAVPEPTSLALVALGGVGLAAYRRRAKGKAMTPEASVAVAA